MMLVSREYHMTGPLIIREKQATGCPVKMTIKIRERLCRGPERWSWKERVWRENSSTGSRMRKINTDQIDVESL
jgi:hypothetical protein